MPSLPFTIPRIEMSNLNNSCCPFTLEKNNVPLVKFLIGEEEYLIGFNEPDEFTFIKYLEYNRESDMKFISNPYNCSIKWTTDVLSPVSSEESTRYIPTIDNYAFSMTTRSYIERKEIYRNSHSGEIG